MFRGKEWRGVVSVQQVAPIVQFGFDLKNKPVVLLPGRSYDHLSRAKQGDDYSMGTRAASGSLYYYYYYHAKPKLEPS
jgi:hypothetical protein